MAPGDGRCIVSALLVVCLELGIKAVGDRELQVAIQSIERMWRLGACERCKELAQAREEMLRKPVRSVVLAGVEDTDTRSKCV